MLMDISLMIYMFYELCLNIWMQINKNYHKFSTGLKVYKSNCGTVKYFFFPFCFYAKLLYSVRLLFFNKITYTIAKFVF